MTKQKSTQAAFDPQAATDQHRRDLLVALELPTEQRGDTIARIVGKIAWIKKRETEPPENVIPTTMQIDQWWGDLTAREQAELTGEAIAAFAPERLTEGEYPAALARLVAFSEGFARMIDNNPGQIEAHLVEAIPSGVTNQRFKFQAWTDELITELHQRWLFWREYPQKEPTRNRFLDGINQAQKPPQQHFLTPVVKACIFRSRTIETASVTQANGSVRIPYRTSEILRRNWKPFDGDVSAVIVDDEPLTARIADITPPARGKKARIYTPNAQGQMTLAISTRRQPDQKPVPLIAFEQFSGDLRSPLATDVAILMTAAHASNQDIRLTSAEGARFLARGYRWKGAYQDKRYGQAAV